MNSAAEEIFDYLHSLGLITFKNERAIYTNLVKQFGHIAAEQYLNRIETLAATNHVALYEAKNANYKMALAYSYGFDGNIYKAVIDWITVNKSAFGKEILDIGCDCGIITCYLAKAFPESHITAIDRGKNGIKVAKELAKNLGIKNITFITCSVQDLTDRKFDTIFSMRTIQENRNNTLNYVPFMPLLYQMEEYYYPVLSDYASVITNCVKEDGNIISIERADIDPLFLGWITDLNRNDTGVIYGTYRNIICKETGDNSSFQAVVAQKGKTQSDNDIFDWWCSLLYPKRALKKYNGWAAEAILVKEAGDVLDGYAFRNATNAIVAKFAVYKCTQSDDTIFAYSGTGDEIEVERLSTKKLSALNDILLALVSKFEKEGLTAEKI